MKINKLSTIFILIPLIFAGGVLCRGFWNRDYTTTEWNIEGVWHIDIARSLKYVEMHGVPAHSTLRERKREDFAGAEIVIKNGEYKVSAPWLGKWIDRGRYYIVSQTSGEVVLYFVNSGTPPIQDFSAAEILDSVQVFPGSSIPDFLIFRKLDQDSAEQFVFVPKNGIKDVRESNGIFWKRDPSIKSTIRMNGIYGSRSPAEFTQHPYAA